VPSSSLVSPTRKAFWESALDGGYSRRKLLDRMIAAQALDHRATLVTLNAGDFRDVPGLELLSWRLSASSLGAEHQ
jgi:predicted nucleic acid-binding protein